MKDPISKGICGIDFTAQRTLRLFILISVPIASIQADCAENGAEVNLILDEKVYNRMKNDFEDEYNTCLRNRVSLYIYSGKVRPSSFMVSDNFMLLKLFG